MNTKLRIEIARSYLYTDTIAMAIVSVVALWLDIVAGLICLVFTGMLWAYHRYITEKKVLAKLTEYKERILEDRSDMMDAFSTDSGILICVLDNNLELQWSNPLFEESFPTRQSLYDSVGKDKLAQLFDSDDEIKAVCGERIYKIKATYFSEEDRNLRIFFFSDISEEEFLKVKYKNALSCVAYINADNYDEIIQSSSIENRSRIAARFDQIIFAWAREMDASVYRLSEGRYTMVFLNKYLTSMKEQGFPILNRIREIETEADFPPSLSIGIGSGQSALSDLQQYASEALELALGRGGDQTVVRNEGGENEYYGGNLPSVEKRNKGKSRVMAHALTSLIKDSDKVLIMGHARPDLDSFGASLGIYAIANNLGKECHIVLEQPGDAIESVYKNAKHLKDDDGSESYSIVNAASAHMMMSPKTLLVMVDHHRQMLSEVPALCDSASKIAVIDHHRRSADAVEKTMLSFMESYASSTCELVSEMLQYLGERGEISKFEAEVILSGICVDTKNFTINTGVRTFEAASWLKRKGADTNNIRNYFKTDLEFYQKKINVIANAEILPNGFAVAYTKDIDPAMQLIVSQAADELLSMKGVEAAVAAGRNGQATMVSARSNGKYNVQTLMETLGGGGHQQAAAVQLQVGPEEAISQVVQAMRLEGLL